MNTLTTVTQEHPFAHYISLLGKGKHGSRHLTQEEAQAAMTLILNNQVEDVQLGAFLLLLRYQQETAEELAGFAKAVHQHIQAPKLNLDLDWPSYAGKRRHYPWYLIAAKVLANQGITLFMHGAGAYSTQRLYSEQCLTLLDIPLCQDWATVSTALKQQHIAFMPLACWAPQLQYLINLRSLLGVRSSINSLVRLSNPLNAHCSLQSIFHPNYQLLHQQTNLLLAQPAITIKGEGGETECCPDSTMHVLGNTSTTYWEEEWPAITSQRLLKPQTLDLTYFSAVWHKQQIDEYAELAIPATIALGLRGTGIPQQQAQQQALQLWKSHSTKGT